MDGPVEDVFATGAYWSEYYTSLGHENREVGEFLAQLTRALSPTGGLRSPRRWVRTNRALLELSSLVVAIRSMAPISMPS